MTLHRRLNGFLVGLALVGAGWSNAEAATSQQAVVLFRQAKNCPLQFAPQAWWDAADAATITISSGSSVSQWNDKSGNGRNAVQGTLAKQPTLQSGAYNGRSALRFSPGAQTNMTFTRFSLGASWTIAAVFKRAALGASFEIIGDSINASDWPMEQYSDNILYVQSTLVAQAVKSSTAVNATTAHVAIVNQLNATGSKLFIDGADVGSIFTAGTTFGGFVDSIGRGDASYSFGDLLELIVYSPALSNTQAAVLQGCLKTKWATP